MTRQEKEAKASRLLMKMLIADGVIPDPANRPKRYQFHWCYGEIGGIVMADDKSTARALIKKDLGLSKNKRLPKEVEIVRINNEDKRTCPETCVGSSNGRTEDCSPVGDPTSASNGSKCSA